MHTNLLWRAFLLAVFAIVLGYSVVALYRVHRYAQLTRSTQPESIHWSVHERADDEFMMQANYTIRYNAKEFSGETVLPKSIYRNGYAAEQDLPQYQKQKWTVWFDPSNPHHSTLQKSFPLKECISAIVLWGLFLYFLWLGFYVGKFKT